MGPDREPSVGPDQEPSMGPDQEPSMAPEDVVRDVHMAVRAGDMVRAHKHIAYEHRLEEVLGDVWRGGSDEGRRALVTQVKGMFERTSRRLWEEHVGDQALVLSSRGEGPGPLWVEARLKGGGPDSFRWKYRLQRLEPGWRITQREAVIMGVSTDTGEFFRIVMRRLESSLGHAPDLQELVTGLPEWSGRVRKRVLKIPRGKEGRRVDRRKRVPKGDGSQ